MKRRAPVVWKKDPALGVPVKKQPIPRRHQKEEDVPESDRELYENAFVPGHLFAVVEDLEVQPLPPGVIPPAYPPLQKAYKNAWKNNGSLLAEKGSIAMYVGSMRVEEEGKQGRLRLIRHTFIIGNGRFMVPNLNWVYPVT